MLHLIMDRRAMSFEDFNVGQDFLNEPR